MSAKLRTHPTSLKKDPVKRSRALIAALPLALAAALLTACSGPGGGASGPSADAAGVACTPGGDASNSIKVEGDFGAELKLTSSTPVTGKGLERTVLTAGTGDVFAVDASTQTTVTIFNGKTGAVVNHVPESAMPNTKDSYQGADWAYAAVRCGQEGQRVALVVPVSDALGGADPKQAGFTDLTADDSFVIVIDFLPPFKENASCEKVEPRDQSYPKVDLGDGTTEPKITIPECMEAPTELETKVLVEGTGPVVTDGESVMTNYVGVYWSGAERFDGSWTPTGIKFSTAQGALIDGFRQAMIGQKIGSTILVTVPSELGYKDGKTRTFVLQLVSAVDPAAG